MLERYRSAFLSRHAIEAPGGQLTDKKLYDKGSICTDAKSMTGEADMRVSRRRDPAVGDPTARAGGKSTLDSTLFTMRLPTALK
jgi:hypothetical protein